MHRRLKKEVKIILALMVMVIGLLVPGAVIAKDIIGSKIQIERIDGTAYVVNTKGSKTDARIGVKLSNNESLQTAAGSYAYISLDDTKVLELDELSQVNIQKSGKKLKIEVEEGNIFFQVKEPLAGDEAMTIGASTMSMSIRGTAGVVGVRRVNNNIVTSVNLIEGRVVMTYSDVVGEQHEFNLWGGESATHKSGSDTVERDLIDITEFPGFAARILSENPELSQEMLEKSGLNPKYPEEHWTEMLVKEQEYNAKYYYDVFEEGNVHSVASREPHVEKVIERAVEDRKRIDEQNLAEGPVNADDELATELDAPVAAVTQQAIAPVPNPQPDSNPGQAGGDSGGSSGGTSGGGGGSQGDGDNPGGGTGGDVPPAPVNPTPVEPGVTPTPTPIPTEYKVSFIDAKAETPTEPIAVRWVMSGQRVTDVPTPYHEGFVFVGWTPSTKTIIKEETFFYAQYEEAPKEPEVPEATPTPEPTVEPEPTISPSAPEDGDDNSEADYEKVNIKFTTYAGDVLKDTSCYRKDLDTFIAETISGFGSDYIEGGRDVMSNTEYIIYVTY